MIGHHPDCDGYRTAHRCTVERVWHGAAVSHTYRAVCDECGPIHAGTFGPAALDACRARANAHAHEVECDGRCLSW